VTLVPDERVETLVRTVADHLAAFGGIPLVALFDRPKTVALKWGRDGVVTEWNPTFAGDALDLGIGVEVCWPYRPQEKGAPICGVLDLLSFGADDPCPVSPRER